MVTFGVFVCRVNHLNLIRFCVLNGSQLEDDRDLP